MINGSFLFPNAPLTLCQTREIQNLSCYFRETTCTNIFSTGYLLIWNNFTPLIVIIYVGALYHDIVVALLWSCIHVNP